MRRCRRCRPAGQPHALVCRPARLSAAGRHPFHALRKVLKALKNEKGRIPGNAASRVLPSGLSESGR